jgi:hypothetical protein
MCALPHLLICSSILAIQRKVILHGHSKMPVWPFTQVQTKAIVFLQILFPTA